MNQDDPALGRAERHVKSVRDFWYHVMTYAFVNTLLVILDRRVGPGEQAFLGLDFAYWVMLFWGLGVVGHAVSVFFGENKVQKVYEQEKNRHVAGR